MYILLYNTNTGCVYDVFPDPIDTQPSIFTHILEHMRFFTYMHLCHNVTYVEM